jgi:L-lactate dehydrogenase
VKIGIVGVGNFGCAIALAAVTRGSAREIVLVDRDWKKSEAVATDIRYGVPLGPKIDVRSGDYDALADAGAVLITAGVNEKSGGATDRNDPAGRLRLLEKNAGIFRQIVPRVARAAPNAVLIIVTDPPDPLADITRDLAQHDRVLSTGTFMDSLRFRVHLGRHFGVDPRDVEAQVLGEHGTSQVFLWSSARIAGAPVAALLPARGEAIEEVRAQLEKEVRYANIAIIEGHDASQYGIGIVSARIAEMVLRDERAAIPIGSYHASLGVTLSLPSIVGAGGIISALRPEMSIEEQRELEKGAEKLQSALKSARARVSG